MLKYFLICSTLLVSMACYAATLNFKITNQTGHMINIFAITNDCGHITTGPQLIPPGREVSFSTKLAPRWEFWCGGSGGGTFQVGCSEDQYTFVSWSAHFNYNTHIMSAEFNTRDINMKKSCDPKCRLVKRASKMPVHIILKQCLAPNQS